MQNGFSEDAEFDINEYGGTSPLQATNLSDTVKDIYITNETVTFESCVYTGSRTLYHIVRVKLTPLFYNGHTIFISHTFTSYIIKLLKDVCVIDQTSYSRHYIYIPETAVIQHDWD